VEYEIKLNNVLEALGMEVAFDRSRADFGNMCPIPPNVFINGVRHKTFVEVNEEGTEAAGSHFRGDESRIGEGNIQHDRGSSLFLSY
jgi:serine protease inhibitor